MLVALVPGAALAAPTPASQSWVLRHQPDRFEDRVLMEAFADAAAGPARLALYCDTDNGFRVMLMPHQALMPEGPARITVRIDGAAPVTLDAGAFGDDSTDVVTLYGTAPVQAALAGARHVTLDYAGGNGAAGRLDFTFQGLATGQPMVMKTCPLKK